MSKLDVLVLFDLNVRVEEGYDFKEEFKTENFETEADVCRALRKLGHAAEPMSLFDEKDLERLLARIQSRKPDLVFNLSEAFRTIRRHEASIVALLEMLEVRYTGADSTALAVCKDKALAKKILSFHKIRSPRFLVSPKSRPVKKLRNVTFPVFVKPTDAEGSEGIAKGALAEDEKSALERCAFIHESLGSDALVEEFIEGREIYAGVLGNERLQSLPLVELLIGNAPVGAEEAPEGAPRFFTYKAKWDAAYRKKWQIRAGAPKELPEDLERKIGEVARKAYKALHVNGYGRVDLRVRPDGEIYVIEVNPNPGLASSDELAKAATRAGIEYETLIERIVNMATSR